MKNEALIMNERTARLRTHQKNIERYQSLLKTKLTEAETQFVEKRLSEERVALAMLEFMAPVPNTTSGYDRSETPE
jgi:hypothetical protein